MAVLSVGFCTDLLAQAAVTLPLGQDPAQVQKQREELERQRLQRPGLAPETAPTLSAPTRPKAAGPASGATFVLRRVVFGASQLLRPEDLAAAVAPQLDQPTTFADVQALVQRINALYVDRGQLTARALVPPQKVQDGVLNIQLVEATLARIDMPPATRLSPGFVRGVLGVHEGELINVPEIGERLERLHRGTDTRLALSFLPADEPQSVGQSVISVQVDEPSRWSGRLSLSNEGNVSVGRNQLSFNGGLNNLLGYADRLNLLAIYSKGSSSANLQFSAGAGPYGTRAQLGASVGTTKTLTGPANDLIVDGGTRGLTLGLTQPLSLWRGGGAGWALEGALTLGDTHADTRIAGETFSNVAMSSGAAALTLSRQSEGGSLNGTLTLTQVRTVAARLDPLTSELAQLGVYGYQQLGESWSLQAHGQLQFTHATNLPSTLQVQIGGPASVRGFAAPSAAGDRGGAASIELHRPLDTLLAGLEAFAFADHGRAMTAGRTTASLSSAGLGLTWRRAAWSLATSVAVPRQSVAAPLARTEVYLRLSADL